MKLTKIEHTFEKRLDTNVCSKYNRNSSDGNSYQDTKIAACQGS